MWQKSSSMICKMATIIFDWNSAIIQIFFFFGGGGGRGEGGGGGGGGGYLPPFCPWKDGYNWQKSQHGIMLWSQEYHSSLAAFLIRLSRANELNTNDPATCHVTSTVQAQSLEVHNCNFLWFASISASRGIMSHWHEGMNKATSFVPLFWWLILAWAGAGLFTKVETSHLLWNCI